MRQTFLRKLLLRLVAVLLAFLMFFSTQIFAFAMPKIVFHHTVGDGKKQIALTFDDGPHPRYTPLILDILRKYGVSATFFTVGINVDTYTDLVKREIMEGHEVGNHTYHHYRSKNIEGNI
jgi:peptidoglycan/xylan/chitin deacetylase (PgdA/CDA1 family)